MDSFFDEVAKILRNSRVSVDAVIPYKDAALVAEIRKTGQLLSEEYEEEGVHIKAYVPRALADKWELERGEL